MVASPFSGWSQYAVAADWMPTATATRQQPENGNTTMTHPLPTYFISHGGGPWPYVPEMRARMQVLEASLADIPRQIGTVPRAVLVVSGHWEAPEFTVMGNAKPPMVYDYSGFPEHTYHVLYPAPGAPNVAHRVQQLAGKAGIVVGQGQRSAARPLR